MAKFQKRGSQTKEQRCTVWKQPARKEWRRKKEPPRSRMEKE